MPYFARPIHVALLKINGAFKGLVGILNSQKTELTLTRRIQFCDGKRADILTATANSLSKS